MQELNECLLFILDPNEDGLVELENCLIGQGHNVLRFSSIEAYEKALDLFIPSAVIVDFCQNCENDIKRINELSKRFSCVDIFLVSNSSLEINSPILQECNIRNVSVGPLNLSNYVKHFDYLSI